MTVHYGHSGNRFAPVWNADSAGTLPDSPIAKDMTSYVRIPNNVLRTANGKLLNFCELRTQAGDEYCQAICVKISSDRGKTWGPSIVIAQGPLSVGTRLTLGAAFELSDGTVGMVCTYWPAWIATNSGADSTNIKVFEFYSDGTDYETWPDAGLVSGSGGTEITSSVIKVNNSSPAGLPATLDTTNDNWTFLIFTDAERLANGDVVVSGFFRYDGNSNPRFATFKRTAAGVWSILGGLEESSATNDNMTESALCQTRDGAYLLAIIREKVNNTPPKWTKSADGGVTWSAVTSTGITSDSHGGVQMGLCINPDNTSQAFLAAAHDSERANTTVWDVSIAEDGTPTFGNNLLLIDAVAGYAGIACFGSDEIIVIQETNHNPTSNANNVAFITTQQERLRLADITAGVPEPIWHQFNERPSGKSMLAGPTVLSRRMDVRAYGNAGWTYSTNGVLTDGTNGIILNPPRVSSSIYKQAYASRAGGSWTFEIVADWTEVANGGTTQQIAGDRSTGAGWALTVAAATGIPTLTLSDGTNSPTATGPSLTAGSQPKALVAQYDRGSDTIRVFVDGVGGTAATDTTTGSQLNDNNAVLGAQPDTTTNPLAADVEIYQTRFWRKVVASGDFLTASTPKQSLAELAGGYGPPAYSPINNADCVSYLGSFDDGGLYLSADWDCGLAPLALPPKQTSGIRSFLDPVTNRLWRSDSNSKSRPAFIGYDSTVGPFIRYPRNYTSSAGPTWGPGDDITDFDYIPSTCKFTLIFGAVKRNAAGVTQDIIFDTRASTSSNGGMTFYINPTTHVAYFDVGKGGGGGGARISANTGGTTFAIGTWYAFAIVGGGASESGGTDVCTLYWAQWPGNMQPITSLTSISMGSIALTDSAVTIASGLAPTIGALANTGGFPANLSWKNWSFYDEALTQAQILEALQSVVYARPTGGMAAMRRRRV